MAWLLTNWKILTLFALAFALYFIGDHNGASRTTDRYELKIAHMRLDAQESINRQQAAGNVLARQYETERAAADVQLSNLMGDLDDEKQKNSAYSSCHAGPRFLQLYRELTAGKGNAGEHPHR